MITSKSNEIIKHIKALHQKKYRNEFGEYFVEGIKLVKEAIDERMPIKKIIICEELLREPIELKTYDVVSVNKAIFGYIADTQSPQGIIAIIEQKKKIVKKGSIIFALDDIQDPGNLGTIIRTLDCAGINSLLLSSGTVDLYNPKVLRSTMGAIYRVNVESNIDLIDELLKLKEEGYQIVVTDLNTAISHYDLDFDKNMVIVIGNEANGVSENVKKLADIKVKIPMLGRTESLNAGVAASIIAYERVRKNCN